MFSLQKLLGKEDKFFDLLEASAAEARSSVLTLAKYLHSPDQLIGLDELVATRRKDKAITAQITDELCTTVVTALEREDIEALSVALYKVPKTVEKIAERILLAPVYVKDAGLAPQMKLLQRAVEIVLTMIQDLRQGAHMERIKMHNAEMQAVENEADDTLLQLLRVLYNGQQDTARVVFLKDLFELMERVVDRCRDAGNVISQIVRKNS